MARRTVLVILLIGSIGYAIYTYWPLVSPYFVKPEAEKAVMEKIMEEVKVLPPETPPPAAEKAKAEAPIEKRVIPKVRELINPFSLRVAVRSKKEAEAKPEKPAVEVKVVEPKLEGIWIGSGLRAAFISGQVMTEGGIIMGWRVASIAPTSVVLRKGRMTKILRLEGK